MTTTTQIVDDVRVQEATVIRQVEREQDILILIYMNQ